MEFDPKNESQLDLLDDDDLIDHISQARDAGQQEHLRTALGIFVFRRYDQIRNRIRVKVDSDQDVEDLTMQVVTDVMRAKFDGRHVGEAVNLISTVIKRRIADFHEAKSRARLTTVPEEADDEHACQELSDGEDFTAEVALAEIVTAAIDDLSESHALVARLSMTGLPADQVAGQVNTMISPVKPMTAPNVHQIMKRFRDRIEVVLEESER